MKTSPKYRAIAKRCDVVIAEGFGSSRRIALQRCGAALAVATPSSSGQGITFWDGLTVSVALAGSWMR